MALDCILAVRLSAAFDCLTPATTGTSRDPKTPGECHLYLAEGCHLYIALTQKNRISVILEILRLFDRYCFVIGTAGLFCIGGGDRTIIPIVAGFVI